MDPHHFNHLIAFWRSVEAFSPQAIPKLAPGNTSEPVRDWEGGGPLPWVEPAFLRRPIAPSRVWRHGVYGAIYPRAAFIGLLEHTLGKQPDVFEERAGGECCVFHVAVDEHGRPLAESLTLSMAAWALGIVETHGLDALGDPHACDLAGLHPAPAPLEAAPSNSGFPGFDTQLDALREELAWRLGQLAPDQGIDGPWLADFADLVVARLGLFNLVPTDPAHRVRSVQVMRPKPDAATPAAKQEDNFLNSFFIRDLNRIAAAGSASAGQALTRYLAMPERRARLDVRNDRAQALALLDPKLFPQGCWPAAHPLVWSQQLAINALWRDLQKDGIFAVNGPPGTGKTTLLRDVVAAVVVERARLLADKERSIFGARRTLDVGGRSAPYYLLDPALSGHAIVVASSNNGAVENLSLELPSQEAIDPAWAEQADLYGDIASELLGKPAWALVAGRLGNKANRNAFTGKFWWQKADEGKVPGLRARLEDLRAGMAQPAIAWDDALTCFRQALDEEDAWRTRLAAMAHAAEQLAALSAQQAQAQAARDAAAAEQQRARQADEALAQQLADGEESLAEFVNYQAGLREIRPGWLDWLRTFGRADREWRARMGGVLEQVRTQESANAALRRQRKQASHALEQSSGRLAPLDAEVARVDALLAAARHQLQSARALLGPCLPDLAATEEDQERSSPWAHPDWRAARIAVFIAALNLHRAFIEDNAAQMLSNLGLAMTMLSGTVPDPGARAIALESLALACPVISTTFASAASLFGELGLGSIGWLLIDEAGQAPPQAAAGAIWRARRTVVVGDPLQLEPVVTLPCSVEASLAAAHGGVQAHWLPTRTSVQALADAQTPIGTHVGRLDDAIWVGAPLRVHRRCDEPMFSISNRIAYDGLMVHQKRPAALALPASAWIDVARDASDGNWVPAEGEALRGLLRRLAQAGEVKPESIFLVSPFRDVVQQIRQIGKGFGLPADRIGTVHTTQGKEADVVILVVGGGSASARDWAASKPNLLNVAVSRAKGRLYVIGDRRDLARRPHFDVLAAYLPVLVLEPAAET